MVFSSTCCIANIALWYLFCDKRSETVGTEEFFSPIDPEILKRTVQIEKACGTIVKALGKSLLRVGIDAEDDPFQILKLLDSRWASNLIVSKNAVQTKLFACNPRAKTWPPTSMSFRHYFLNFNLLAVELRYLMLIKHLCCLHL